MADLLRPEPDSSRLERCRALVSADPRRAVIGAGVALLASAFAVLAGTWVLRAPSGPAPELTLPRADAVGTAGPPTSAAAVVVDVAGAVARPGVYQLDGGARVVDALRAAGGATPEADLNRINQAEVLRDGQRVYVPRRGETPPVEVSSGSSAGSAAAAGPLDLNHATLEELDGLPGIGPTTAQAIIDYRTRHGRFRSVDELLEVRGIGPAKLEELRPLVAVL